MTQRLGHLVDHVVAVAGDDPLPFVALENIASRTGTFLRDTDLPTLVPEPTGMTGFRAGDVLFGKLRPYLAKSWRADRSGICSTELIVMRPRSTVDDRWLGYLAQSDLLVEWAVATSEGVKMPRTSWEKLRLLEINAPSLHDQRAIADYLDAETARIDALAAAKHRLSGILDQRRRTIIGAAVTGRLTETARAVAEARARPLRVFAHVDLGRSRSPETSDGPHMVQYLRAANVKNGFLALESIAEMNFTPTEQRFYALRPGDVLVTEGAGSLAAVGANAVWNGEIEGTICFQNHLLRIRATDRAEPRFIAWWARFAYESGLFGSIATGAQILNLGAENVRALPVRIPSRVAQRAIADLLDAQVGSMEAGQAKLSRQIELLLERRLALITAAVTGQLHIPGVAA